MNNRILGVLAAVGVTCGGVGCSDSGPSSAGGGGGGAGGHALPNQGGISLSVQRPANPTNGQACPVAGMTYAVGAPTAPSDSSPGTSLVDGDADAGTQISCAVQGTGPFTFAASLQANTTGGNLEPIVVEFTNGKIGADYNGTANVSVYTPELAGNFTSSSCVIQVLNQQVKGGSIWASFSCPSIVEPPASLCAASGIFVFENCTGS